MAVIEIRQDGAGGAETSITAAEAVSSEGDTLRILDAEAYDERVTISEPDITLEAGEGVRHQLALGTGHARIHVTSGGGGAGDIIVAGASGFTLRHLDVRRVSGGSSDAAVAFAAGGGLVDACLITNASGGGGQAGVRQTITTTPLTFTVRNSVAHGFSRGQVELNGGASGTFQANVEHCELKGVHGVRLRSNAAGAVVRLRGLNLRAEGSTSDLEESFVSGEIDWLGDGASTHCAFAGTNTEDIPNSLTNVDDADQYVDPDGEWTLKEGADLIDAGTDAGVSVDALGTSRPQGSGFDIGPHEFVSAPAPPSAARQVRRIGTKVV